MSSGASLVGAVAVPQTSEAVAEASQPATAGSLEETPPGELHSTVMGAGAETTGGVVSTTVTVEVAVPTLPQSSCDVHVTVVVVPGRQPEGISTGASCAGAVAEPQASAAVAEASQAATAGSLEETPPGELHSTVMGAGADTVGGVVSTTVMVELAVPTLPQSSCELHVTVTVAPGAQPDARDAGASCVGAVAVPQASEAVADASQAATAGSLDDTPPGELHSTVMGAGGVTTGPSASTRAV
jgi:hypothetical protein